MFNITETADTHQLIALSRSDSPEAKNARTQLFFLYEGMLMKVANRAARRMGIRIPYGKTLINRGDIDEMDPRYEDLHQVASLALLEALRSFDLDRGVKFSTYLWHFVGGRLKDYLKSELGYSTNLLEPTSSVDVLDSESDDDGDVHGFPNLAATNNIPHEVEMDELQGQIEAFLLVLSSRQRNVIVQMYWQGGTQTQVARDQKVSTSMVHKVWKQVEKGGQRYFGVNPYV